MTGATHKALLAVPVPLAAGITKHGHNVQLLGLAACSRPSGCALISLTLNGLQQEDPAILLNRGNDYLHYEDDWFIVGSKPDVYQFIVYRVSCRSLLGSKMFTCGCMHSAVSRNLSWHTLSQPGHLVPARPARFASQAVAAHYSSVQLTWCPEGTSLPGHVLP